MRVHHPLDTSSVALRLDPDQACLDIGSLFGIGTPVELELGMGKGTFLVQEAPLRPGTGFIGVELDRKIHDYAADRMRRRSLGNVRTWNGDAAVFVRRHLADGCLAAVHVYFPDPWHKQRHQKRRLLQADFAAELVRVLGPGGELRIASDHAGYAAQIARVLAALPLETVPYRPPASAGPGEAVGTNFERKYRRRDGRSTFVFARRKRV